MTRTADCCYGRHGCCPGWGNLMATVDGQRIANGGEACTCGCHAPAERPKAAAR